MEPFLKALETQNIQVCQNGTLDGVILRDKVFRSECTITNTQLTNCIIMNSFLTNTKLDHCIIAKCELRECRLIYSSIKESKVIDSEFTFCLRSKCDVTPTPPLNRIPPEIGVKIFSDVIEWKGKTPALIAAVRGDPVLYREALGVLRRTCTFSMHRETYATRQSMRGTVFQNIKKLMIE